MEGVKFLFVIFAVATITTVMYVLRLEQRGIHLTVNGSLYRHESKKLMWLIPKEQSKPPVILFWTNFFSDTKWGIGVGINKYVTECNVTCEITNDKSRFQESKAVMIHPRNPVKPLPKTRQPWQYVIFFLLESPTHTPNLDRYANMFNYTMAFRLDSDIPVPYGYYVRKNSILTPFLDQKAFKSKTKDILWLVSNCHPPSRRDKVVAHLQKFIKVDVFGGCGKSCNEDCAKKILLQYKFYLAFENSLCDDYATEKVWKTLKPWGLVPIVYGGANYTKLLPPKSYINVADFTSLESLAKYIRKVSANKTLYDSYFEWKRHYFTHGVDVNKYMVGFCQLCNKIHQGSLKPKTYANLQSWWSSGRCRSPAEQFPFLKKIFT